MTTHITFNNRRRVAMAGTTLLIALTALATVLIWQAGSDGEPEANKGRRSGIVLQEVVDGAVPGGAVVMGPPGGGFSPQTRLGFSTGDQWEPAIAADDFGHIYVLYAQYYGVPGCDDCQSPTQIVQISNDGGTTWGPPHPINPESTTPQWDSQIVVDPVDGRTVYAAYLENNKSDVIVAKSTDFGQTWSYVAADGVNAGTDKPILAVRGQDVYVAFNHSNTIWFASSHDGGQTFTQADVQTGKHGWSLPSGGTVTPEGTVYFSWDGYKKSGNASGGVNLYVTKSTDGGRTWQFIDIAASKAPPNCSEYLCGWAYLGAQIVMDSDEAGVLYLLWNANSADGAPNRVYFSKSADGGGNWTVPVDVSLAPAGKDHAFPAIVARSAGDVRISWMDARESSGGLPVWNTYYRSSSNGGNTWSAEVDLSTFVAGFSYIFAEGFRYPFGDYYEIAVDNHGVAHLIWGEGFNYDSPGSIWYSKGN